MRVLVVVVVAACGRIGFDPVLALDPDAQSHTVAAGERFSCAIRSDTTVWCWGDNAGGQIGESSGRPHATPVQIPALERVIAIDGGDEFACALRDDGTVWCWGGNDDGQLGTTDQISHTQPIQVALPDLATQISAGTAHACARLDDGTAWCWGRNDEGQIANTTYGNINPPILQLDNIVQIAAGDAHTCAVRGDGSVWCWGYTEGGRLGRDGDIYPAPIPSLTATSVSAFDGTCAIVSGGHLSCWGVDTYGELGDGQTGTADPTPTVLSGIGGVVAVAIGDDHTCALLSDQTVSCWGHDDVGQLGTGDQIDQTRPSPTVITDVVSLAVKGEHTCVAKADGSISCWGRSSDGEVGNGSIGAFVPQHVDLGAPVTAVSAGGDQTCAIAGPAYCWGYDVPITQVPLSNVVGVASGETHTCGWLADGTAWCVGGDGEGEIGDGGSIDPVTVPFALPTLSNVTAVVAGQEISCAISGGAPTCWGRNLDGALGNGTNGGDVLTPMPMSITYAGTPLSFVAGGHDTCMTTTTGAAYCTGDNQEGQLGIDSIDPTLVMTPVMNVTNAKAIATSGEHTCVTLGTGSIKCWGAGDSGQLGDGNFQSVTVAVDVGGLGTGGAGGLATGFESTCASAGAGVQCWGDNTYGQLGDGTGVDRGVPTTVMGIGAITAISAGDQHVCAISGGELWCWGDNAYGQQGTGAFARALAPVAVTFP